MKEEEENSEREFVGSNPTPGSKRSYFRPKICINYGCKALKGEEALGYFLLRRIHGCSYKGENVV